MPRGPPQCHWMVSSGLSSSSGDVDCYLWWAKEKIGGFLVVHGQVILGQLADHPRAEVKKCALVKQISRRCQPAGTRSCMCLTRST